MKIRPFKPLLLPAILLAVIALIASLLPTFKPIDDILIKLVRSLPSEWSEVMLLITMIGDPLPLIIVALSVAAWELYRRHYVRAAVMAGSLVIMPAFYFAKELVQRARPVTEFVAEHGLHDFSFPSGHSAGTMAIYGMIAFLAYSHMKGKLRFVVVSLCIFIAVFVSFTRVYLGAHFPTDVLAGWLLAFVVISLLRSLSLYLAHRSSTPDAVAIEDTTEAPETLEK